MHLHEYAQRRPSCGPLEPRRRADTAALADPPWRQAGGPDIDRFLRDVDKAGVALLDRWELTLHPAPSSGPAAPAPPVARKIVNNYFSLGMDAKARPETPRHAPI